MSADGIEGKLAVLVALCEEIRDLLAAGKKAALAAASSSSATSAQPLSLTGMALDDGIAYKSGAGAFYRVRLDAPLTVGASTFTEVDVGVSYAVARPRKYDKVAVDGRANVKFYGGKERLTVFANHCRIEQVASASDVPEDEMDVPY